MAKWQKKFEQWKDAKSPVRSTEVKALLERVFGTRLRQDEGTSHEFIISVPELQGTPDYQYEEFVVPLDGGQQVKGFYLRRAYQAAILLELYPPAHDTEDQEENHEQDNYEGSVG